MLVSENGLQKRMQTTGNVKIPEGARKETELLYLHNIVTIVEEYETPHSLIMNLDQTLMNHTMAKQNSKSLSIVESSDKCSITGTFTTSLNGHFLPMQSIYSGKAKQTYPRFTFPDGFSLSCNPKHFSNAMKSIKLINEITMPYVQSQRKELGKLKQTALVAMDVFRGQITDDVISL